MSTRLLPPSPRTRPREKTAAAGEPGEQPERGGAAPVLGGHGPQGAVQLLRPGHALAALAAGEEMLLEPGLLRGREPAGDVGFGDALLLDPVVIHGSSYGSPRPAKAAANSAWQRRRARNSTTLNSADVSPRSARMRSLSSSAR